MDEARRTQIVDALVALTKSEASADALYGIDGLVNIIPVDDEFTQLYDLVKYGYQLDASFGTWY